MKNYLWLLILEWPINLKVAIQQKLSLMIPGPTPVPEKVLEALGRHPIGHRSKDFQDLV